MIYSVLQKLTIIELTTTRLVLRELPLLEWLLIGGLFIVAAIMAILGFKITAVCAFLIALYVGFQTRIRLIVFDIEDHTMSIGYRYLLSFQIVMTKTLSEISQITLHTGEDGGTQIILIDQDQDRMGLSAYSRDLRPWKEPIITAIHTLIPHLE